ncbi:MAG TPA: tripartite tricarboxylate transporter substrate binding protein [Ramlibacter sp.]|nr:tripartite tricarboxylate transporter substrate binding protein [Ramlibacter sp.]
MAAFSHLRRHLLAAGLGTAALPAARAQAWPSRPIRLVLPYPPGGALEPIARLLAQDLTKKLGQPMVVELRPGANGGIGAASVAKSPPDGYTLLIVGAPVVVLNKHLYRNPGYDPETDLTPITAIGSSPMMIVASAKFPAKNLEELVAYAKANPGKVTAAYSGQGSLSQLSYLLLERTAGIRLNKIPYNVTQGINDVLSGEVDLTSNVPTSFLPHIATGRLQGIGVLGERRHEQLPNVPTALESKLPGMVVEGWYSIYGPKDMPAEIVQRLNAGIVDFLRTEEARSHFAKFGVVPTPSTPEELRRRVSQESARWAQVIRDNNVSAE